MRPQKVIKYIFKMDLCLSKDQAASLIYNLNQINDTRLQSLKTQLQAQLNNIDD